MMNGLDMIAGKSIRTGHLSDAMDELGLASNAGGAYRHLGAEELVIGRALTIQQVLATEDGQIARQGEVASEIASPGDVIVIDAAEVGDIVTWGEAHSLRALANGVRGVIIDGLVRDIEGLARRGLPIFYRDTSPVRSKGRLHTAAINSPVELRAVEVKAGDWVAADSDGIVVIKPKDFDSVCAKALEIRERESERDAALERSLAADVLGDTAQ